MLLLVGSIIISVCGIAASVLMRYHWKTACWLSIFNQLPATTYDLLTHQYGFLLITAIAIPTYLSMLWRGRKSEGEDSNPRTLHGRKCQCGVHGSSNGVGAVNVAWPTTTPGEPPAVP